MGEKVSRESAINALIVNPTIKGAAESCGIAEKTLHSWLNEPEFSKKLRKAQEEITRGTIGRVLSTVGNAIDNLIEIMNDKQISPGPRVTAARTLLDNSFKVYELESIQRRLDDLEGRLNV
jgi:hypothetical protein